MSRLANRSVWVASIKVTGRLILTPSLDAVPETIPAPVIVTVIVARMTQAVKTEAKTEACFMMAMVMTTTLILL
jgi:hypothetical protein